MQDNSNTPFDPTLVDRGWLQLQQQLDQAMPQRRRRFLPWLLVAVGLVAVVSGSYVYFKGWSSAASNQPVALGAFPVQAASAEWPDQNEPLREPISASAVDKAAEEYLPLGRNPKMAPNPALVAKSKRAKTAGTPKEAGFAALAGVPSGHTPATGNHQATTLRTDDHALAASTAVAAPSATANPMISPARNVRLLNNLAVLTASPLVSLAATSQPNIQLITPRRAGPWNFYAEGQGTTGLSESPAMWAAGLGIQRKLSTRFSLEVGGQYQATKNTLSLSRNDLSAAEDVLNQGTGTNYTEFTVNLDQAYQNLAFTRLNGLVNGVYALRPRLKLAAGFQASYYLNAYSQVSPESSSFNPPGTSASTDGTVRFDFYNSAVPVFSRDALTNVAADSFNLQTSRWQYAAQLGVRYELTPHWEVHGTLQQQLTAWPEKANRFGSDQFIQLGLRYYLK